MYKDQNGWIEQFKKMNALWLHDGSSGKPHAVRTRDGYHTNNLFFSDQVLKYPMVCDQAASDLVDLLIVRTGLNLSQFHIDFVVGYIDGGVTFANDIARQFAIKTGNNECCQAYLEHRCPLDLRLLFRSAQKSVGETLICIDDLVEVDKIHQMVQAVNATGSRILPYIITLINRTGKRDVAGLNVISLIEHHRILWTLGKCELCSDGSAAIYLDSLSKWDELAATNS